MSIAEKDIEYQLAEAVPHPQTVAKTQILIIGRGDALVDQLAQQMASDAAVSGHTMKGTLPQAVAKTNQNWGALDFVVFEIGTPAADIAAVTALAEHELQFVAVSQAPVADDLRDRFRAAGVAEVLVLPVADAAPDLPAAPLTAPNSAPASEVSVETGGSVTVMLRARGGAGATTVAVNLAVGLASGKHAAKTALVDLDLQNGSVGLCLDLPESAAMTDFVKGDVRADATFVDTAMQTHASGLDVLTAPDVFAPLTAVSADDIAALIDMLKSRYDHIVLDMPQAVIDWLEPALARADRVLVVTDMSVPSIKRTRRLIDLITEEHMTLPIETVVNFEKRPRFQTQAHKEASRLIGRPLAHWVPDDPRVARRATDMGVPLQIGSKRSAAAKAIALLAGSIAASKRKV